MVTLERDMHILTARTCECDLVRHPLEDRDEMGEMQPQARGFWSPRGWKGKDPISPASSGGLRSCGQLDFDLLASRT